MAPATSPAKTSPSDVTVALPAPTYSPEDLWALLAYTRNWIQYGLLGFTVVCILIGAIERMFGR